MDAGILGIISPCLYHCGTESVITVSASTGCDSPECFGDVLALCLPTVNIVAWLMAESKMMVFFLFIFSSCHFGDNHLHEETTSNILIG